MRRVSRALEAEKIVSSSRAPRLLHELISTLRIWAQPFTQNEDDATFVEPTSDV